MDFPLRTGTAGWTVPAQFKADIPGGGSHLERYARRLNAVEINSSFYRPHQRKTYERWAGATPDGFRFSVKMPKAISHEHRLKDCVALIDRFLEEIAGLGDKLGVLLLQLPPTFSFDESRATQFFESLAARTGTPIALEPRHASWFGPQMDRWLAERHVARVAADPAPVQGAGAPGGWPGLAYYRWHGSPKIYYSDYGEDALAALGRRLYESRAQGETWCIFDNTALGAAFGNALSLKERDNTIL
ncbi:MAG: DUF72 domain-containing protein [Bradyrhizobiaceae bacterium]|nr:MAG: DUF72 domain-containing protein [Bradyrhizobiaceae bacterium]